MRRSSVATNEKRRLMRSGKRLTPALIVLALAACGELPHGLEEIRLSFEGFVTSAVDGAPIEGPPSEPVSEP